MERIELEGGTDLRELIERVHEDGMPRLVARGGEDLAVVVHPEGFRGRAVPRSKRMKDQLLALAGSWHDVDADRMIEELYAARDASPPSPPPNDLPA